MPPRRISVVVTTYNWPQALEKVLRALARQTLLPAEVIVADDGSGEDTRACLQRMAASYPVPLRHCWQEDQGFRVARARNLAIASASGDYVVLLDGDMVPHPSFLADHAAIARRGHFVQGSRVLTTAGVRDRLLATDQPWPSLFDRARGKRRYTLRLPAVARAWAWLGTRWSDAGIKTCNQGWWREDLVALNGFDERYVGWGREDKDLAVRALHLGLGCRPMRFAGLAAHLHHLERHDEGASPNDGLLDETRADPHRIRSLIGLDRHPHTPPSMPPDLRGLSSHAIPDGIPVHQPPIAAVGCTQAPQAVAVQTGRHRIAALPEQYPRCR